jgi:membrane protease YdiL (CAAX protease family)
MLIGGVTLSVVSIGGDGWYESPPLRLAMEIGGALATFVSFTVMAFLVDRRGWRTLGFNPTRMGDVVLGAVLGAAIFLAPIALLSAVGAARYAPDLANFSRAALGVGLAVCFFNVITQELLVRSYIFQELWSKFGALSALVTTTVLFVALHAAPILQGGTQGLIAGLNVALASVLLGLAYLRSGALWAPIGIHLGWNGLQGPVLGINVTGTDIGLGQWRVFEFPGAPLLTGGELGVEGGLAGLLGPLIGIVLVMIWLRPNAGPAPK